MKIVRINFCIVNYLIVIFLTLAVLDTSAQEISNESKKTEDIKKIATLLESQASFNKEELRTVKEIAEKAALNLDTYVHIAELISEFGYHTVPLIDIAKYASKAKIETPYFKQLAELVLMKLDGTSVIVDVARELSKISAPENEEIEKEIKELAKTANYKTLDEAKAFNKDLLEKYKQNH